MKITVEVEMEEYDTIDDLREEIIKESARQMIDEQLNNYVGEKYEKTYKEKLQDEVKRILLDILDADFKESIKEGVIKNISNKFQRTKQCKEVMEQFDIKNSYKTEFEKLVKEFVKEEIQKRFK